MTSSSRAASAASRLVELWRDVKPGTAVLLRYDHGSTLATKTRSKPWLFRGYLPAITVDGPIGDVGMTWRLSHTSLAAAPKTSEDRTPLPTKVGADSSGQVTQGGSGTGAGERGLLLAAPAPAKLTHGQVLRLFSTGAISAAQAADLSMTDPAPREFFDVLGEVFVGLFFLATVGGGLLALATALFGLGWR
jgi:hypothetical protein